MADAPLPAKPEEPSLDSVLQECAKMIAVASKMPLADVVCDIPEWRVALGKYTRTVENLFELRNSAQWNTLPLNVTVKHTIEKYFKAASSPDSKQSSVFEPRSAAEATKVTALCKKHTSLDAVFQAVQWLSISAYEALGDAIDFSHDRVLRHLEGAADREFFGALVLWIHRKKSLRAKFHDASQPISLPRSPWLLQTLQNLHLLEYEVLLLLVPHHVFQTRLRLFAALGAPTAGAFGPLVAEAREVYLAWERGPWKAHVTNALGDEVVTQLDIRIKRGDSLDDVNLLEKQCEAALWPSLFIYRDVSMNEHDVFASRHAARVEEEMKNAWAKTCKPYLDQVNSIKRKVEINGPQASLLQRVKNKFLEPCNVCPADETLRNGSSYTYDVVRRWATLMAARASMPDQALEVKWDNHLWVYLFDACFDQVVDSLTLHRREKKSISASTVRAKIKKVDAIVTPKSEEQPEILYLESQLPGDEKHFVEDRDKLFKLMKAELIWRIPHKISTLVLGMMTQGPAVQLYLMDLCTYDSLMIVKVADLSLYRNNQADLASFLDVAVQMLAAREYLYSNPPHALQGCAHAYACYLELLRLSEAMCPSEMSFPLTYPLGACTRRLFRAVDAKYGEVFVKRERDRERAEAELSALVRLRGVPGVASLLHTELNCGDRIFVFPLLTPWSVAMHAQSLYRVCVFCRQLFEALAIIHEHGVAHRDLHPGNILYDAKADQVVVTDFGLARFCSELSTFGGVGTDGFRAPEVVDAVASTVACDVFSAGVLFAMLLRELVPSAFQRVDDVLGEEDLSAGDIARLKQGCEQDDALPASAKDVLVATLDSSPASRPSARRVLSFAFFDTEMPPSTPVSSRKRVHPPSPPSSESSPEQVGE